MLHYQAPMGYPTPPASPSQDFCQFQQSFAPKTFMPAAPCYLPLAPEERLGRLLEGKLQLTDILGTGAYGVVYLAVDVNTHVPYAVKCLSKFNADGTPLDRRQVAYQQREIRLHHSASTHPNVVSMHKIVEDPDCIYVVLEYCPEGDLFQSITERSRYVGRDDLAKNIFLQILDAVEHCHKLGIYHRDLKPENILVTDHGDTVKLADFGLATSDDRSEDYGCGSTFYMSPECLDHCTRKPYYMCAPNDVWSLGVILVNLTCGRNPWKQASLQDSTYRAFARSPQFLKTILPVTDELNDILARIFHPNPEQRITLAELRQRILAAPQLTVPPMLATAVAPPSPPVTPEHTTLVYVSAPEEATMDDFDHDVPLSAVSSSDSGSLISSAPTIEDLDEDMLHEQPPVHCASPQPPIFEPESQTMFHPAQEFVPSQHYNGPVPSYRPMPVQVPHPQLHPQTMQVPQQLPPPPPPCQPRSFFPWDLLKYVQQVPLMHHQAASFQQAPMLQYFPGRF